MSKEEMTVKTLKGIIENLDDDMVVRVLNGDQTSSKVEFIGSNMRIFEKHIGEKVFYLGLRNLDSMHEANNNVIPGAELIRKKWATHLVEVNPKMN